MVQKTIDVAHGDRIARRSGPLPPVEEDTLVLEFGLSHRAVLEFLCGDHFRRLTGGCGPPPTAVAAPTFPPAADRPVSSIQNPAGVSGRTRAPDPSPCLPPDRPVSSFQNPGGRAPSSPARADPAPCTMDARFRMQRCAPTQPADFARAASSPSPQSPARLGSGDRLYKSPSARAILHGPFVRRHQWVCSWYLDEVSHTCMRTCPTVQRERQTVPRPGPQNPGYAEQFLYHLPQPSIYIAHCQLPNGHQQPTCRGSSKTDNSREVIHS